MKADFLTQIVLPFSLFIIMFGMGLALKLSDFLRVFKQPKAISIGIVCQMVMLPLMACLIIVLFGLTAELAVGLLILALCPGGATSNMISYLSRGDVALSISLTALVSLITPFSIPIVTAVAMAFLMENSQQFSIPILKTILQLIVITIVPVAIGMIIHKKFPVFSAKTQKPIKIFSIVFLFVIIAGLVAKNWEDMAGFFVQTGFASFSLNVICLTAGYLIAKSMRLEKAQSISISIEVGIQNGTLALVVAGTLIGNPVMTIPAVTYSLLMFITGGIFGWLVNRNN
ncbi:MAG: bile acid:sodium symporter family protein [Kangiellaceae bacterium]|nr:bile acid:sodium symporter family protein [Kangiellaceae bacterium]MCW8999327.1 bile acid:sodium symporter family protein [Kangiellaceae bacterium]